MSENMSQLRSQTSLKLNSFDSEGKTISAFGLTQAQQAAKSKPRFMNFASDYSEVRYSHLDSRSLPKIFGRFTNMSFGSQTLLSRRASGVPEQISDSFASVSQNFRHSFHVHPPEAPKYRHQEVHRVSTIRDSNPTSRIAGLQHVRM